jgi:hypothetical protein
MWNSSPHGTGEKQLPSIPLLKPKLTPLTGSLTSGLLQSLSDPMQRKSSVVHLTGLLERLHAGAVARSAFLVMRGELMRKRVRALRYVFQLGIQILLVALYLLTDSKVPSNCISPTLQWLSLPVSSTQPTGFLRALRKTTLHLVSTSHELWLMQIENIGLISTGTMG